MAQDSTNSIPEQTPEHNLVLDAALKLAAGGVYVARLHGITEDGRCTCPNADTCRTPGKHPRYSGEDYGSTTDPEQLRRWFEGHPDRNAGIDLETSGLVDIAPDSSEWLEEFKRRGLPETYNVRSGGGDGLEQ